MHKADFTQIEVPREMLGEAEHKFLEEGLALRVQSYEGQPLIVRLPKHMTVGGGCIRVGIHLTSCYAADD